MLVWLWHVNHCWVIYTEVSLTATVSNYIWKKKLVWCIGVLGGVKKNISLVPEGFSPSGKLPEGEKPSGTKLIFYFI